MNLYVRYFNHETLATSMDDVIAFIESIPEIKVSDDMYNRVADFLMSENTFPFRLKVSYSNYVLFLKTEAEDLDEFRVLQQQRKEQRNEGHLTAAERKQQQVATLSKPQPGWYEGKLTFKRVMMNAATGKCSYVDTVFRARMKAESPMDCYERIIEHLKNRQDVDPRSQFPSAKNNNFEYNFLGENPE